MSLSPFKLLCGVGLLALFSSTISKSPTLPLLVSHLGGGPASVGTIASVSAAAGILCSLPAGILSDRIGRKHMLVASAVVFATAPFFYLLARQIWQLAIIRFYHGLATAVFVPVAMAMVSDLFAKGRGEKMGWFSTATLLGRFMAPATGGVILGLHTADPGVGFRTVYLACGAAGLCVLAGALLLPNQPTANRQPAHTTAQNWRDGLTQLLANRAIMATCGVEAAILFAYGVFETFLPGHCLASGLNPFQIGVCLSSQVITIALSKPLLGRFSDRHGRPPQILVGAMAGAGCITLFSLANSFLAILFQSILLGLAIAVVTSASVAHIADLSKAGSHGSAMGILGSVMDLGHTTGPLLGGFLAASLHLSAAFLGAGAVLAVAGLLFLRLHTNHTV